MSNEVTTMEVLTNDERGRPCKTKLQWDKALTLAQINTAWATGQTLFAAITNCGMAGAKVTANIPTTNTAAVSTTGANTSMDKIRWKWKDADGNPFVNMSGAPKPGQILANDIDVNTVDTDVAAWIAWVLANLKSPYGKAVIALLEAIRFFRNRKAKNK